MYKLSPQSRSRPVVGCIIKIKSFICREYSDTFYNKFEYGGAEQHKMVYDSVVTHDHCCCYIGR